MKLCPKCKESIQDDAKRCKHCQADLRNWFAKHKILTGILIFFLIGVIGNIAKQEQEQVTVTSNSATTSEEAGTTEEQTPAEEVTPKIGDTVSVGKFSYTVDQIEERAKVGNQYVNETASGKYILVHITALNQDSSPQTLDNSMFALIDESKREFSISSQAMSSYSIGEKDGDLQFFIKSMQPGLSEKGTLIFDIPTEATGLKLKVSGGMWSGKDALIDLR